MKPILNRRQACLLLAAGAGLQAVAPTSQAYQPVERRFTIDLCPGRIGVGGSCRDWLGWAKQFQFESIEPDGKFLARLTDDGRAQFVEELRAAEIRWGAAGLPVEFRRDEAVYQQGMSELPEIVAALQSAGVDRVGTYIMPRHESLTYVANLGQHAERLQPVARLLQAHGMRLGLEYVGPKTLWTSSRYPFVHTLAETMDLIEAIGEPNVGVILDSWHWYTSGDPLEELAALSNEQVIAVDLNDAPRGRERDQQIDSERELPTATGVIDLQAFLQMLIDKRYDGPVRAEPFNRPLNEMEDLAALEKTSQAMHAAVRLVEKT